VQPPAPGTDVATQIEQLRERFNQGNAAIMQGQPERARGIFADVAQTAEKLLSPEAGAGPDQQIQLDGLAGQSWLAAGKPDRALDHFELLSGRMPDNLEVITGVAAAQLLKGDLNAADATLNRVFSLNADFQSAHFMKACLLLKRNEPLRAAREFKAAGGFDVKAPVAPWIRLVLADLDCKEGRFQ